MAAPGRYFEGVIGPPMEVLNLAINGVATNAMPTLNNGWCVRFTALSTNDVLGFTISWGTITAAGAITARIETIDATTGKPTGTLYDANAVQTAITPTVGIQTITFASAPTTGLVVGTEYALVILVTTTGTAHTINSHTVANTIAAYPVIVLTAADGTTRANFAEVASSRPICVFNMEDGTTDSLGCQAWGASRTANTTIYSTLGTALKLTLPVFVSVAGVRLAYSRTGTPAGDLRLRVLDASDNVVTGTTVTIDKDSLTTNAKMAIFRFPVPVTLGGTIRLVLDSAASASSANTYGCFSVGFLSSTAVAANMALSTCPDIGTPVWTDSTTEVAPMNLILDDLIGVLPGRRR